MYNYQALTKLKWHVTFGGGVTMAGAHSTRINQSMRVSLEMPNLSSAF